jgi:sphingomyelin phosphodiesterase
VICLKFDAIYWTGDIPPHNIWNQNKQDQIKAYKVLIELFKKHFPNIMVLPSVGNHETDPVNL